MDWKDIDADKAEREVLDEVDAEAKAKANAARREEVARRIAAMRGEDAETSGGASWEEMREKIKSGAIPPSGEAAAGDDAEPDAEAKADDAASGEEEAKAESEEEARAAAVRRGEWPDEITLDELWRITGGRANYDNEIFKDLWLERGGGAFWISSSGTGKSVHSVQAAYAWALGRPYFGIRPARALRVAYVQTEDSINEVTLTMKGMRAGYMADDGGAWTAEDVAEAERRVVIWNAHGRTGAALVEWLRDKLEAAAKSGQRVDVVIFNPFTSFFSGELNSQREVDDFLKGRVDGEETTLGIDMVAKNPAYGCAVIFFHHTAKPTGGTRTNGGGKGYDAKEGYLEYIGSGSSAITNWARAVLVFLKEEGRDKREGYFTLWATKRGPALEWTDEDGKPTIKKTLRHTRKGELVEGERLPFWKAATDDEAEESRKVKGDRALAEVEEDAELLAKTIKESRNYHGIVGVVSSTVLTTTAEGLFKTDKRGTGAKATRAVRHLLENLSHFGLVYFEPKRKDGNPSGAKFCGTPGAVDELKRSRAWAETATDGDED